MNAQAQALHNQLIHWFQHKHQVQLCNTPSVESAKNLTLLINQLLLPIEENFGAITISYGFVGAELNRYIQCHSPVGTAPLLDQHACCEVNSKGKAISQRPGAACDFFVLGFEDRMHEVVLFICQHLAFDKLYFYGRNRPIHLSISESPLRHLQVMQHNKNSRRYPGKKAFSDNALALAKEL